MKKPLIILTLAILQCACATQVDSQRSAKSMPGFDAFSAEISVDYEKTDAADDLSQTVTLNNEYPGSNRGFPKPSYLLNCEFAYP